jgi:hypothetical protein
MHCEMALKRNSHVYAEEESHVADTQNAAKGATYRSRRASPGSAKEDVMLVTMEAEDAQNKTTVANAAIITRSQTTLPSSKEAALSSVAPASTALRTAEALVLASAAFIPTNNQPIVPEVPMVSNNARPHNFGIVMPGITEAAIPSPTTTASSQTSSSRQS